MANSWRDGKGVEGNEVGGAVGGWGRQLAVMEWGKRLARRGRRQTFGGEGGDRRLTKRGEGQMVGGEG